MAQITLEINGILKLQKRMAKIVNRIFPKFGILAEAIVKFGVTPQDLSQKSETLYRAREYFQRKLRKQKRGDLFIRKYRRRGERMRRGT